MVSRDPQSIAPFKGVDCDASLLCANQNRWGACKNHPLMAISYKGDLISKHQIYVVLTRCSVN